MEKSITLLILLVMTSGSFAQSPDRMSYQAVIRNSSNILVTNHAIGMKISILQGTASGLPVYEETQTPATNANGLVSIEIGGGTVLSGAIANIDWTDGPYFIRTETDPTGGTNYSITGISQILSVPYAFHAQRADNITGSITETDPIFMVSPAGSIISTDTENWNTAYGWGNHAGLYQLVGWVPGWTDISGKPDFAVVATSGSYDDLADRPGIAAVAAQGNSVDTQLKNVTDPTDAQDAATKAYVDLLEDKVTAVENILIDAGLYRVTDADGNSYPVVKIGNQLWMAENLKTTKYNDGSAILLVTDEIEWSLLRSSQTPGYCWYNNNQASYGDLFGALYNWYAVNTSKLCPTGWHVPANDEWTAMEIYLQNNGYNFDGSIDTDNDHSTNNKIAKSLASDTSWGPSTITGAVGNTDYPEYRNLSGFTALPAGARHHEGWFSNLGYFGTWWSAEEYNSVGAWNWSLYTHYNYMGSGPFGKQAGFSVRCLKNE